MPTIFFLLDDMNTVWAYTHTEDIHRALQWIAILKKKLMQKKQVELANTISYIEDRLRFNLIQAAGIECDSTATIHVYEMKKSVYEIVIPEKHIAYHRVFVNEESKGIFDESWMLRNKRLISQFSLTSFGFYRLVIDTVNESLDHPDVYLLSTIRAMDTIINMAGAYGMVKMKDESAEGKTEGALFSSRDN
jgi:hypothetical protein